MIESAPNKRIDSIDFWRGVALAIIFVNHIPGNILTYVTPRNFGFSDSAEAFVFLSGMSVSLAYGDRLRSDAAAVRSALLQRTGRLYGAHVALTVAALALFGVASDLLQHDFLLAENGRAAPYLDPVNGLVGIVALSHQIAYFNILPLYVVLLALTPILFVMTRRGPGWALMISLALYVGARLFRINLPSWPEPGGWYFNPLTWQLMFVFGVVCGGALKGGGVPYHVGAYRAAHAFTCGAALVVSNFFSLAPGLVDAAGQYLDWDKTDLGLVRIIDFLALAYVIYFSKASTALKSTWIYPFFRLMGRHALAVYCLGSLLSAVGQIMNVSRLASPLFDILFVGACLMLLHWLAGQLERRRSDAFCEVG